MADDVDPMQKAANALLAAERVALARELVKNTGWTLIREQKNLAIAFIEALIKCAPVFVIQFLAIYPLLALGQGQEAMRGLLDPQPANISWFLFASALSYSCVLTASFSFFLLNKWNYPADNGARAFCRVWVPSVLTLIVGLLWPVTAQVTAKTSTFWDASIGLVNGAGTLALAVGAWRLTKPGLSRTMKMKGFFVVSTVLLVVSFVFFRVQLLFYGVCFGVLTYFCALACDDFRDSNPKFRPEVTTTPFILGPAILFVGGPLLLAASSVSWRMFVGTPTIVVCGFLLLIATAFLLTAALSLASPVLVRVGWMLMGLLIFITPLNHEPLRLLPAAVKPAPRLPPSAHFVEWLRARPEVREGTKPYPVFFIAAEGGGARAAYWTSTLLAGLEERYPGFTEHVYAISGVSGGSVGSTVFDSMYLDLAARGEKGCAPLVAGGVRRFRACTASVFQWDLLGPPLSGLLLNDIPFGWIHVSRATYLEEGLEIAWSGSMENHRFEEPFQDLWRDRPYQVPSLILNSTSADNGHRIVTSNLAARDELTREPDVEAIIGRPIRLSTATFLSARFPVISPEAIFASPDGSRFRLVDGGYFNNSGMATIAQLLRAVLPTVSNGEFAGRIQPVVLVLSSSPVTRGSPPGGLAGSLAGALLAPVSVLENTGDAHEATYFNEVASLVGEQSIATDLRPPQDSTEVALGWMLSAETRCKMDQMVNRAINGSNGSAMIGRALGQVASQRASWTSCPH
jgi:hypothetical protein